MKRILSNLIYDNNGQGLVEYGLIISLVVLAAIASVQAFGVKVSDLFDYIGNKASEAL